MKRLVPALALIVLLIPATAHAKGTNVRISSAPNGTDAGETWTTTVIVTMPGNGRFGGLTPRMIIRKGDLRKSFLTVRTGKTGVHRVSVVFPSRGEWRYGVDDGFGRMEHGAGRVHWFPPVTIAAGQPKLAKPPRPISGDIRFEMAGQEPAPTGQLPSERYVVDSAEDENSDESGAMFPALAFLLAAAVVGPLWIRRYRAKKRAA